MVGEISNNQSAKQLERVTFCQIEASEEKTFYSTENKNNLPKHTYNTNNWGGGGGGGGYGGVQTSHLPYSVHELCKRAFPHFSWLFPFNPLSITKYEALLHNFPLFLQPSPI